MARIADAELYISAGFELWILSGLIEIQVFIAQFNIQNTACIPHGMGRIGAEIHHHLVHLDWVRKNSIQAGLDILPDFNGGRQ